MAVNVAHVFTLNSQLSTLTLLLLLLLSGASVRAETTRPELRAFWADGFNEGYKTPQQIDTLLQRLHDAHCNAVFAQMRKGGDAYYASRYEPWATDDAQHFDALACLIDKAHKMQPPIAVHAWINTCAVGTGTKHPGFHIAQLHPEWMSVNARGRADDGEVRKIDPGNPDAADWTFRLYLDVVRHYDVDGIHFDFVRYGSPRFGYNPVSVQRFRARSVSTLANAPLPAWNDPAWKQWRRDQVTNLVRKVYAHAVAIKPQIVVSAATIAWGNGPHNDAEWRQKSAAMNRVFQDWRSWLQEGDIDLACSMTYFGGRHGMEYERTWSAWVKSHQYERAATIAVGNWQLLPTQTLAQIGIARVADAQGHTPYGVMLYSYAGTNLGAKPGKPGLHELELQPDFYALLSHPSALMPPSPTPNTEHRTPMLTRPSPPFLHDVAAPPMLWKTQPTTGILKGFVRDANLQPSDGARVVITSARTGKQYIRHTDGTGFYAFLNLPPDTYTIQASTRDYNVVSVTNSQQARVQSGKAATCQIDAPDPITSFQASPPAPAQTLDSIQAVAQLAQSSSPVSTSTSQPGVTTKTVGKARLRNLMVVLGTDTYPGNLYAREIGDKAGLCLRIRLSQPPLLPFQPGDIVDVLGTAALINGEPGLDNANACLNDIALETQPASVPVVPLSNLPGYASANHGFARLRGVAAQSDTDGFTLTPERANDTANTIQVRVPVSGRKDFGVEAGGWTAVQPRVGSVVEVTGLMTTGLPTANQTRPFCLLPRSSADITLIAPPSTVTPARWFKTIYVLPALLLLALWLGRKRLRRMFTPTAKSL